MYGQGYDGAANMAGRFKGTQTVVKEIYTKALYVHCAAHSLNLANFCVIKIYLKVSYLILIYNIQFN